MVTGVGRPQFFWICFGVCLFFLDLQDGPGAEGKQVKWNNRVTLSTLWVSSFQDSLRGKCVTGLLCLRPFCLAYRVGPWISALKYCLDSTTDFSSQKQNTFDLNWEVCVEPSHKKMLSFVKTMEFRGASCHCFSWQKPHLYPARKQFEDQVAS